MFALFPFLSYPSDLHLCEADRHTSSTYVKKQPSHCIKPNKYGKASFYLISLIKTDGFYAFAKENVEKVLEHDPRLKNFNIVYLPPLSFTHLSSCVISVVWSPERTKCYSDRKKEMGDGFHSVERLAKIFIRDKCGLQPLQSG